jgi:hypothetical protein
MIDVLPANPMSRNRSLSWRPYFYTHPDFKLRPYKTDIEVPSEGFRLLGKTVLMAGPHLAGKTEIIKHLAKISSDHNEDMALISAHDLTSEALGETEVIGVAGPHGSWLHRFVEAHVPQQLEKRKAEAGKAFAALSVLYHDPDVSWVENPSRRPDLAAQAVYSHVLERRPLTEANRVLAENMLAGIQSLG